MLFTYTLFLVCASSAIASPWNVNHYNRHHQHLTEFARSDSVNAAASPFEAPAPLPEKILASRQSDQDEDEHDECSDEDEDGSTQPQATPAASPVAQKELDAVPGPGNPNVPFTNATFAPAQAIAVSSSVAAPAPTPPTSEDLTTGPSSGDGEAQLDGVGRPLQINAAASSTAASSTAPAAAAASTAAASGGAPAAGTLTASFTNYGAGDQDGSGNCNTATAACGFYNNPGYNAAISQAVFGVGPGAGAGPACGTCYKLMPHGGNSIVVKVNNLCPDDGNPLCSYPENVDVNFDLCIDDGAGPAMFGSGPQQLNGTAVEVDCSQWSGSTDITATS